jgi:MurNAc alpha-1-phosphate uridylyltransferase
MKAFILCAGLGTRLRPISNQIPKCLVEVKGTSLLERHIRKLKEIDVSEIIINLHHKPDVIKEFLNRKKNFGINITFSEEDTLMGTGGALIEAKEEIGTETFILISGDLYTEHPFESQNNKVDGAHLVAVKNDKSTGDFSISEGTVEEGTDFNYGGIALINPTLLADRNKQHKEFWKDIILPAVKKKKVSAEIYEGILKNINTKEDLDFV